MGSREKMKVTRSSGNVFRDLGFSGDEAERLTTRAELMLHLQKALSARGLSRPRQPNRWAWRNRA